jgi:hypothetical protein
MDLKSAGIENLEYSYMPELDSLDDFNKWMPQTFFFIYSDKKYFRKVFIKNHAKHSQPKSSVFHYPFTTASGISLATFLLIPNSSTTRTTSPTSL